MNKIVALTGATGFIGVPLCETLLQLGFKVRILCREKGGEYWRLSAGERKNRPAVFSRRDNEWLYALEGVDVVIHCAGASNAHGKGGSIADEYRMANVVLSEEVGSLSVRAGVKRIVYLSSIKVFGESTHQDKVWNERTPPNPQSDYAKSKFEAERSLSRVTDATRTELVVLRLPPVYGPGASGMIRNIMTAIFYGFPVPVCRVYNQRSMINLPNLIDAILSSITAGQIDKKILLLSDGRDLSTAQIYELVAIYMGKRLRTVRFPKGLLDFFGQLKAVSPYVGGLINSCRVDASVSKALLDWAPSYSVESGIKAMCERYLSER